MVKSANFMRERPQYSPQEPASFIASENSFTRDERESNPLAASFTEGIRGNKDSRIVFNSPESPAVEPQQMVFRKREIKEDSFI